MSLSLRLKMIFDIARHKFYEGITFLFLIAIAAVVCGYVDVDINIANATLATAPLQPMLRDFMVEHTTWSAIISLVLIMATSLRLTRATIIHSLFSRGSLSTMALSAVVILGIGINGNILSTLFVGYLLSEAINRICFCVSPEPRMHYMFTANIAIGAMPLFDSSMLAPALLAPIVIMLSSKKPREIVVALVGLILPIFTYCYVSWCLGGEFSEGILQIWRGMVTPSSLADVDYLTLPRLIMLGLVLFMQIGTSLVFLNDRLSLSLSSRQIWILLQVLVVLLTICFVLLPSTSPASFMCIGLCISAMSPLLFYRIEGIGSIIVFYTLLGVAIWAI